MHEYPITEQIVKIACEKAKEEGAKAVTAVHLVVGEQSGFVGESIEMYFSLIAKGTLCENAGISFTPVKTKLQCRECGKLFERSRLSFDCPYCGGPGGPTDIGKEFYIESIEIES